MNKTCAKCEKTVYPVEELKCLEKIWHKTCFKCQVCGMTLSMKNYKGFEKLPYCGAHVPKAKATVVADTPENKRLAENSKVQSNVKYHADFEATKGKFTQIADDPETLRIKANSEVISNITYHDVKGQRDDMEKKRSLQGGGENVAAKVAGEYTNKMMMSDTANRTDADLTHRPYAAPDPGRQPPPQPKYSSAAAAAAAVAPPPHHQQTRPSAGYNAANQPSSRSTPSGALPPPGHHNNYNANNMMPSRPQQQQMPPPYSAPPQQPAYHQQQQLQQQQQLAMMRQQQQQQQLQQQQLQLQRQAQQQQQLAQQQALQQQQLAMQRQQQQQQQMRDPYASRQSSSGGYSQYGGSSQVAAHAEQQRKTSQPTATNNHYGQQPAQQPARSNRCYQAMYDYEAQDADEVSFKDGDIIVNAVFIDEGWMTGTVHRTGQSGMLPANYVEPVNL